VEITAANEIEKKKIEADMQTQISHIEAMERREAEFVVERATVKEFVTKEMQARMQLEKELADKSQKNLRLEYEAKAKHPEQELREKMHRLPAIRESEPETSRSIIQDRLRGTLNTYTSKIVGSVPSRSYMTRMPQVYVKCRRHHLRSCLRCCLPFPH